MERFGFNFGIGAQPGQLERSVAPLPHQPIAHLGVLRVSAQGPRPDFYWKTEKPSRGRERLLWIIETTVVLALSFQRRRGAVLRKGEIMGRVYKPQGPKAQVSRLENGQQGFRSDTLTKIAKALKALPFRLLMTDKEWAKWERAR